MKAGDVLRVQRTFTVAEVEAFAELTRDRASWHMQPDMRGRLVVHGLLTAALATQIGGELGFMARDFNCTFLRPVYTGETVTLTMTCTELNESSSSGMGSHVGAAAPAWSPTRLAQWLRASQPKASFRGRSQR
jgi:3-hydroxybutyryl-CoA dehydratase